MLHFNYFKRDCAQSISIKMILECGRRGHRDRADTARGAPALIKRLIPSINDAAGSTLAPNFASTCTLLIDLVKQNSFQFSSKL